MQDFSTIESIANATALDPDDVQAALGQIADAYGQDEVDEGLAELAREIPTGEGLTKKEARKLLISEMDTLIILANQRRLRKYRKDTNEYWKRQEAIREANISGEPTDVKPGKMPRDPIFVKGFTSRHLDQAVSKARGLGTYGALLEAAGYRAKK